MMHAFRLRNAKDHKLVIKNKKLNSAGSRATIELA